MAYRDIPIPPGSSNVRSIRYDDSTGTLEAEFVKGDRPYLYFGVPGDVADGFTTSGLSAGVYLNTRVKNQFPYQ
jgi:KTSC domain